MGTSPQPARPAQASPSAFSGAQYLMGLQVFVRLTTFAMNTLVVYIAGRQAFGVASVRFELLLSTILFLSREGLRNALLRVKGAGNTEPGGTDKGIDLTRRPPRQDQYIINVALVPIGVGMAVAGCLYMLYARGSSPGPGTVHAGGVPYYRRSLEMYIVAAWIELWVEPLYVLSRARVLFKLQAQCEGIAVFCRCATVVLVLLAGRSAGSSPGENAFRLVAFAAGQMAYSAAILVAYICYMSGQLAYPVWMCYVPRKAASDGNPEPGGIGSIAATFIGQSLLKHFLTQGDSMVMARFATSDEMGIFALVSNYGSIPARIIFLPLEEASRAVFSPLAPTKLAPDAGSSAATKSNHRTNALQAKHVLLTLGKLQFLLGTMLVVFGTLYSPALMALLGQGDQAAARALAAYCLYLPFTGLNGFLEAFVHSVGSGPQLLRSNACMAGFTVVYMAAAVLALHRFGLGSTGIILANMLNMALRIAYSKVFASRWFGQLGIDNLRFTGMLPHPAVVGSCFVSGAVTVLVPNLVGKLHPLYMLALGGGLAAAVLATIWRYEQAFIRSVVGLRSGHQKTE
ncbi:Oligosaccharide translocation protein rft1 [Coemansia sp. RSA 552]|nr:Oligosaccharide translocation protein rft1 [Coemansia sp. RSA 552]